MTQLATSVVPRVLVLGLTVASGIPVFADCDAAPPALYQFQFDPVNVDVTSKSQTVMCDISASDNLAGVAEATCTFRSGTILYSRSCTATEPAFGTRRLGTFRCAVTIPRFAEAGTWRAQLTLRDAVGNVKHISDYELAQQGRPHRLGVTSASDFVPPVLNAFSFTPQAVNVSGHPAAVVCSMSLADSASGVASATCTMTAPHSTQSQSCTASTPASGSPSNGTYQCSLSLPQNADHGTWRASVSATDWAGNNFFADPATLALRGLPVDLGVQSPTEDVWAPQLTAFTFSPDGVNTPVKPGLVKCTAQLVDAPAGVASFGCTFTEPFSKQTRSCTGKVPVDGTPQAGRYACTVALPRYSAAGAWKAQVKLVDKVGNSISLNAGDLESRGFPTDLAQLCIGGFEQVPEVRFLPGSSKQTLYWDGIPGAVRYNVYRGSLAQLVDLDGDGAPDDAYGSCMNARDPVLTDTWFVDSDVPSPLDRGYYYLVSYHDGTFERGRGARGNGQPRIVGAPCP